MAKFHVNETGWLVYFSSDNGWSIKKRMVTEREIKITLNAVLEFTETNYKLQSETIYREQDLAQVFFKNKQDAIDYIVSEKIKITGE